MNALILLVDDNPDGIAARRSVLEELGYRVVSAGCGLDALDLQQERNPDLVVTDYRMTPMDGLELIAALRKRGFQKPIILLSGFADALGMRAETTGADVVIQKSSNEVANLVRHAKRLLVAPRKPAASHKQAKPPAANGAS